MASLITLCNQALAQIAAGSAASLDEPSIEAREAKRFAEPLLQEIIDWTDWPFARKRVVLASIANDRPAEWLYAYASPADMAEPIALRMEQDDLSDGAPLGGPFTFPYQDASPLNFVNEGGVLYTNVENATLIYSRSTLEAGDLPPLLQRAFVLELAARIALPVKKDAGIAKALQQQAEVARSRAIADEENKSPRGSVRYTSEVEYARAGSIL
jgi:hypothetical protein